jgi:DDE superfamily endonuclease/helix-turn-helix, Psq domain
MPKAGCSTRQYNKEDMEKAINAVKEHQMAVRAAAKSYNVPRATLQRMLKTSSTSLKPLGRRPVFDKHLEDELSRYILEMESKFFGMTRKDVKILAYQLAEKNNILPNPFSSKNQEAGRYWLKGFMARNQRLSIRTPTGTSFSRALGFNKEQVEKFFNLLDQLYEKYEFPPGRIFNVDETGLSIVQSKQPKVVGMKGKRQIGLLTSAERGSLITAVLCMGAAGDFVPPLLVFPRKRRNEAFMKNSPPGSIAAFHSSGWIQRDIFTQWFNHFIKRVKPTKDDPVLLIMDGHYSHTHNLELIDLARENYVTLLSLPPHSTHKMQPLDKAFMGPLKTYYNEEIRQFIRRTGKKVTHYDIAELFGNAYLKVQSGQLAVNGFRMTGIFPFDKNIFKESDFLVDAVKDQSLATASSSVAIEDQSVAESSPSVTSVAIADQSITAASSSGTILPWTLSPIPSIKKPSNNKGPKQTEAKVLSSTPHKTALMENNKKVKIPKQPVFQKKKPSKKVMTEPDLSTSVSSISLESNSDEENIDLDHPSVSTECSVCRVKWGLPDKLNKKWIQCLQCDLWAHELCLPTYHREVFLCVKCSK